MQWHHLRNLVLGLVSLLGLGVTGAVVYTLIFEPDLYATPIGGPFTLSDSSGAALTDEDLRGRYLLIYFGYTYCPDVCPTKLGEMTWALDRLAEDAPVRAESITPIFITVDPERDTGPALATYIDHFHPRFLALTGTEEQIADTARAYNVTYRVVPIDDGADYLMDHTSYIFLMDPEGAYVTHFEYGETADRIAQRLAELVDGPEASRAPG